MPPRTRLRTWGRILRLGLWGWIVFIVIILSRLPALRGDWVPLQYQDYLKPLTVLDKIPPYGWLILIGLIIFFGLLEGASLVRLRDNRGMNCLQ